MLVCRYQRLRRLGVLSSLGTSSVHTPASSNPAEASTSQTTDEPQDSIFTTPESPWDHVFSSELDVEPTVSSSAVQRVCARLKATNDAAPAPTSIFPSEHRQSRGRSQRANANANANANTNASPSPSHGLVQRASGVRHQRASITAREMSVFDEMFDMIFNAVSAREGKKVSSGARASGSSSTAAAAAATAPHVSTTSTSTSSLSSQTPSIGRTGAPLNDLFRTLRRRSRVRWTTAIDEELDRKKETMELFNTDYDLLQWMTKEVFKEAQQWDEEAKRAMTHPGAGAANDAGEGKDPVAGASPSSLKEGPGKHSIYPHLIAHAMRIFRTTYSNPSLSLAIFEHAARMSIPSYVFGCTAPAYNELIEAKWEGWGDLEGVCNALEEMRANGVKIDGRTRIVVEKVRREVGEARPAEPGLETAGEDGHVSRDDVGPLARRVWEALGEAEVMKLLHRIERFALRDRSRKSTSSPHEESWKSTILQAGEDDGWSFDGWDKKTGEGKKQRGKAISTSRDKLPSRTLDGSEQCATLDTQEGEMAFR